VIDKATKVAVITFEKKITNFVMIILF